MNKPLTDFNDLHQLKGLDEVKNALEKKLSEGRISADETTTDHCTDNTERVPRGFELITDGRKAGLYWINPDSPDGRRYRISSPLIVLGQTRNMEGENWGRLVQWHDVEGRRHEMAIPAAMLCSDNADFVKALVDGGLEVPPTRLAREKLAAYIMASGGLELVRCTSRTGWHGDAFVLPDDVISSKTAERYYLQSERLQFNGMTTSGTASEWRDSVGLLAIGNFRLIFSISLAFAAVLAEIAGESGGFHFVGSSSIGKSTIQLAASSVWGDPQKYRSMWRATANGLESLCFSRNDLLLVLDDLGECDGKAAGEAAYMIANGQGKVRSNKDGNAKAARSWRTLLLSSGEIGLGQHMSESGKQIRAGQEVRMVDLPANAGVGLGVFDQLNGGAHNGAEMSELVRDATLRYHGEVGREFLRFIVDQKDEIKERFLLAKEQFIRQALEEPADGQVMRTIGRFALVGFAGELATAFDLTGWQPGEASMAASKLFSEYKSLRGGAGNSEIERAISGVKAFLEAHGDSRFSPWDDDGGPINRTNHRVGFKRQTNEGLIHYIFPEAFKRDVCQGYDPNLVLDALHQRGFLHVASSELDPNGKPKRYTTQIRLPSGCRTRVHQIMPSIWEAES
jgi:putative DNA primase/helicase